MDPLDDLPKRHSSHDIEAAAEDAFVSAIRREKFFFVQKTDRKDYGTDMQIEARHGGMMTNARIHVQVKGTTCDSLKDGSVSVAVDRTNLNYLLSQEDSIYVCWHSKTDRLLVCFALDVYREYSRKGSGWKKQKTITINFNVTFDRRFQKKLCSSMKIVNKRSRARRLESATTPPKQYILNLYNQMPNYIVSKNRNEALEQLRLLYDQGKDDVISHYYHDFDSILGESPGDMQCAFLAEINLGINEFPIDETRAFRAIEIYQILLRDVEIPKGELLYCLGNAWFALKRYEDAKISYDLAIEHLNDDFETAARCFKNYGSIMEIEGSFDDAIKFYKIALELLPELPAANLALGLGYHRYLEDYSSAVRYFDRVIQRKVPTEFHGTVYAWRAEAFFQLGQVENAFRDVNSLLMESSKHEWIWPWCASLVQRFWDLSLESTSKSLTFWNEYTSEFPDDIYAFALRVMCAYSLIIDGIDFSVGFSDFKKMIESLVEMGHPDPAFLWDRVGHAAQHQDNWADAEQNYRKAYGLEPEKYCYCLGTALNVLGRYDEALEIVLEHAHGPNSDEMSWFQVAIAKEGVGDYLGAVDAYEKAIAIDLDYELAWFNLAGVYWNQGEIEKAKKTWEHARKKFPDHELAKNPPFPLDE